MGGMIDGFLMVMFALAWWVSGREAPGEPCRRPRFLITLRDPPCYGARRRLCP